MASEKKSELLRKTITHPFAELSDGNVIAIVLEDGRYYICRVMIIHAGRNMQRCWQSFHSILLNVSGWFKNGPVRSHKLGQFKSASYAENSDVGDNKKLGWSDLKIDLWKKIKCSIPWRLDAEIGATSNTMISNHTEKVKRVELLLDWASNFHENPSLEAYKPE
jgi:hypothetical protein